MNTCILITSHLNTPDKIKVALDLLAFLKNKNLPIIFVGNFPLPTEIQSQVDYTLYIKENPKANRVIYFNGKSTPDYGYAHLHQIGKGFKLCQSLGFDYIHHLNYDVVFEEKDFNNLMEKGKEGKPIVYGWGPSNGFATNCFSFKIEDYLSSIEKNLHFYQNGNPPGIDPSWFCEIFFKWALEYSNMKLSTIKDIKYKTAINSW